MREECAGCGAFHLLNLYCPYCGTPRILLPSFPPSNMVVAARITPVPSGRCPFDYFRGHNSNA